MDATPPPKPGRPPARIAASLLPGLSMAGYAPADEEVRAALLGPPGKDADVGQRTAPAPGEPRA